MTDDLTKTPIPEARDIVVADAESIAPADVVEDAPELPEGKTLRAYLFYAPDVRCTECSTKLKVKVFDGMPPRGHDDNINFQEIVILGVGHCPRCSIQVVGAVKGLTS